MPRTPKTRAAALGAALLCLTPLAARGESALRLETPPRFGAIPAETYDAERRERVGAAQLVIEPLEDDTVRLLVASGIDGGARTVIRATFARDEQQRLEPLLQESRSFEADGTPLGTLSVDHRAGLARCFGSGGEPMAEVALPEDDRVANAALSLLFLPLVRGEVKELEFQMFVCSLGYRVLDFVGSVAKSTNGHGADVVEVRYSPDYGLVTLAASGLLPRLSVWFDPQSPHRWLAHRVPLYGKGPEVLVVRDGIPTGWLATE